MPHSPLALALLAGRHKHPAGSLAARTARADSEKSLRLHHLARTLASRASGLLCARFGPASATLATRNQGIYIDIFLRSVNSLFETEIESYQKIVARPLGGTLTSLPSKAAAEGEEILENISKRAEDVFKTSESAEPGAAQAFMAICIIELSLLSIVQHLVGFGGFLEFLFSFLVAGISVRMVFERKLPIRFFDIILARLPRHA